MSVTWGRNSSGTMDSDDLAQTEKMLAELPEEEGDPQWDDLIEWEQDFLPSVRRYLKRNGIITPKQFESLTRIYERLTR